MKKNLNILFIEDSEDDALLIQRELIKGGYQIFALRIDNESALVEALHKHNWDLVLADYVLPQFSGIKAIRIMREIDPDLPCIMISGRAGEETAVEAMRAGASDFILKNRLSVLLPVIDRVINETELRKEKKLIESQLSEKEEQYLKLFESSSDAIVILDGNQFADCNKQTCLLLGMEKPDIIGRSPWEISPNIQEDETNSIESAEQKLKVAYTGIPQQFEWQFTSSEDSIIHTDITLSRFQIREKNMLMAVIRNISERKNAERNQKLAADILELLNHSGDQVKLIENLLHLIKESTHVEMVGIRLKKELDYPYYATLGFPENFPDLNAKLYRTDHKGKIITLSDGQISYSCLCGSVINSLSTYNPILYTPGGSLVIGSQEEFANANRGIDAEDFRGYCTMAGYESIALIPLKSGTEIMGILQLNDHRKNHFSQQMVHFFEGIGSSIGISIKRINDEEIIRLNEEKMREIIENSADAIVLTNEEGRIIEWNIAAESLLGCLRSDAIGQFIWDVQFKAVAKEEQTEKKYSDLKSITQRILKHGIAELPDQLYATSIHQSSGITSYVQTRLFAVKTSNGYKIGSISRDISEIKKAREIELQNMLMVETMSQTAMDFVGLTVDQDMYGYIVNKLNNLNPGSMIFAGPYDASTESIKFERSAGIPSDIVDTLSCIFGSDDAWFNVPIENETIGLLKTGKLEPLPDNWRMKLRNMAQKNIESLPEAIVSKWEYCIGLSDQNNLHGAIIIFTDPTHAINKALNETFISQASVALTKLTILSALQKSENRFNSLFEQNNDIIFTLDQDENITSINPIGEKLITGKLSPGFQLKTLLSATAYNSLRKTFLNAVRKTQPFCSAEVDITARNGSLLTFQMNFSITYLNKQVYEIFGIARNITSNKLLQNQILSKIIETEEREKKSFAEELHDGLGSLLSTINIYVGLLQKKEKTEEEKASYMRELNKLVHEAVSNVRLFANSLTPNVLNDFGLLTAVRLFGDKINTTRKGLITIDLPDKLPKVEKIIEINIYRILMELINNSMKYSGAQHLHIAIKSAEKYLIISFTDDGKGFNVDQILNSEISGMGVKNIFARVKSINGSCDFESSPDKGVNVHIMLPRTLKLITK